MTVAPHLLIYHLVRPLAYEESDIQRGVGYCFIYCRAMREPENRVRQYVPTPIFNLMPNVGDREAKGGFINENF